MDRQFVNNGDIQLEVFSTGSGPLILCVHGWPEHAHSWRHQQRYFADRGYQVAALNVRGYGHSSNPPEIAAYTLRNLASDVAAVATALDEKPAILFGHDWGAPVAYHSALLHPQQFRAVAGLSVPYLPPSGMSALEMWRSLYPDSFFYQLCIEEPGKVEAEIAPDIAGALRRIYFALSGNAPLDEWLKQKAADDGLLSGLIDPEPFPDWLTSADLQIYLDAFTNAGFHGAFNRYRAQHQDALDLADLVGAQLEQPSCFIGGSNDAVRHFVPGGDLFADPGANCTDFRGSTLIPGIGHWVQQEAPEATNSALEAFLQSLN